MASRMALRAPAVAQLPAQTVVRRSAVKLAASRDSSRASTNNKWSSDDEATIKLPDDAEIYKVSVLDDLRPTQLCVGMQQVHDKVKKIKRIMDNDNRDGSDLKAFLKANPVPCVLGAKGRWYMIDHHHFACALYQLEIEKCYAGTLPNIDYSMLSGTDFWQAMWDHTDGKGDEQPLAWLYNQNGDLLTAEVFADKMHKCKDVSDLTDDKYRSLAALVRKADPPGYYKTTVAFAEFKWANYLRNQVDLPDFKDPDDVKNDVYIRKGVTIAREANDLSLPGLVNAPAAARATL